MSTSFDGLNKSMYDDNVITINNDEFVKMFGVLTVCCSLERIIIFTYFIIYTVISTGYSESLIFLI